MGKGGPAILDPETWDRLRAMLTDPRRRKVRSTQVRHLLSGIALCGREGCDLQPMLFTTNGAERVPVYRCLNCYGARHRDRVDEVVLGAVAARLARPDARELFTPDVDLGALQARATELRGRRDALAEMLADGLMSPSAVREQALRIGGQLADVEREIDAVAGVSPVATVIAAEDVAAALDELPLPKLREVIRTLADVVILPAGKGVRFSPEQVAIRWRTSTGVTSTEAPSRSEQQPA